MTESSEKQLADQVQEQLARLDHFKNRKALRDKTIMTIAQALVDGKPTTPLLGTDGVVGWRTYYDKNGLWFHNPEYMEVQDAVEELYREREYRLKEAAEDEEREKRHRERAALLMRGKSVLASSFKQLGAEIARIEQAAERHERETGTRAEIVGLDIPIKDIVSLMRLVLQEERAEFNESPSTKVEQTIDWKTAAPKDMNEDDLDAALDETARKLVAEQIAKLQQT